MDDVEGTNSRMIDKFLKIEAAAAPQNSSGGDRDPEYRWSVMCRHSSLRFDSWSASSAFAGLFLANSIAADCLKSDQFGATS